MPEGVAHFFLLEADMREKVRCGFWIVLAAFILMIGFFAAF